jgi:anti-sigma factor RsiW
MKEETELKLLAYVDGELPQNEAAEVESLLKENVMAADLVAELRWSGAAVGGNESAVPVPEGREFYWSKISRAIDAAERQSEREAASGAAEPWWRRMLIPVAGLAAVALVLSIGGRFPQGGSANQSGSPVVSASEPVWEDANVYEFYDEKERMSVIWVTTDGNNELATPTRENLFRDDEF